MAYKRMPDKDPQAVLDYAFDWSTWLQVGEGIASYDFVVTNGLALESASESNGIITAFFSGGTDHKNALATCHIFTDATPTPREDDRTILIPIRQR